MVRSTKISAQTLVFAAAALAIAWGVVLGPQKPVSIPQKIVIANDSYAHLTLGLSRIVGEITNNDALRHQVQLKALFYGRDRGVIGRAFGSVTLKPHQTKDFSLYTTDDVSSNVRYEIIPTVVQ